MISIVICSRNSFIPKDLEENIKNTIGIGYELVIIDNSANTYSIFTAYNKGIELSKYPYICFMHDDIIFHTNGWGKAICRHLEDSACGIIGVSGTATISRVPASLNLFNDASYFIQSDKKRIQSVKKDSGNYNECFFKPVIALDGVFLCARKSLFDIIRFDEERLKSFHGYDIDICLQSYTKGFENHAINDLLLEHFSPGKPNRQWIENIMIVNEKWKSFLPLSLNDISEELLEKKELHYMTYVFLKRMIRSSYSTKEINGTILHYLDHIGSTHSILFHVYLIIIIFFYRLIKRPLSLFSHLR